MTEIKISRLVGLWENITRYCTVLKSFGTELRLYCCSVFTILPCKTNIIMAASAAKVDGIPAVEVDAMPVHEDDATPTVEGDAIPAVEADAIPLNFNEDSSQPVHKLDPFLNKLSTADYRSIFFLLIGVKFDKKSFLLWVKKEKNALRNKFLNIYYEFRFKDALLIEIFGTMQKNDLLKLLGTCVHVFKKDKETFSQLSSQWKFLFAVCEQLSDNEVDYLKEKSFPEDTNMIVSCAEELICQAFLEGKLDEENWESKIVDIFESSHPDCSKFITSYDKGSKLSFYPLRRPTKTAPCGIAVIMNHVTFGGKCPDRPGSDSDARALKELWESFGFRTVIYQDLTAEKVNQVFAQLSKDDHSNYDAFVACYLSHGDEGTVFASDGYQIKLTDLVDLIANTCDTLVGKPKLFFVQACQGQQIQTGFGSPTVIPQAPIQYPKLNSHVPASRQSRNNALRSDVLLFNSSIEGFASFRQGDGSWFIDALVSNMKKYGEDLTITNVLTKVVNVVTEKEGPLPRANIEKCKQTPVANHTLKYELKLKKVL